MQQIKICMYGVYHHDKLEPPVGRTKSMSMRTLLPNGSAGTTSFARIYWCKQFICNF